jgi:CheY-like chemotaxis protein
MKSKPKRVRPTFPAKVAPRVLVVDDNEEVKDVLARHLEDWGFHVDAASSWDRARALLTKEKYESVILDNKLYDSHESGSEFLLQNRTLFRETREILYSAFPTDEIKGRQQLEKLGVEIFTKRVDAENLEHLRRLITENLVADYLESPKHESIDQELIAVAQFGSGIKLVSLTSDGRYHFLDEHKNYHNILYLVSSETAALRMAIDELESLMNDKNAQEKDFQAFFERNPDFILSEDYSRAHAHIVLTKEDGAQLIPDFVLEPFEQTSLCDLLELKLPTAQIFVLKKNRVRFSAAVSEACAQLREYSLFFDETRNRDVVKAKYGLLSFRPKMFVIIGRRGQVDPINFRQAECDFPGLQLRTYDAIVDRMKARADNMMTGKYKDRTAG